MFANSRITSLDRPCLKYKVYQIIPTHVDGYDVGGRVDCGHARLEELVPEQKSSF